MERQSRIGIRNKNYMKRHNGKGEWEQGIGMGTGMGTGNVERGTFSDHICVTPRCTNSLS